MTPTEKLQRLTESKPREAAIVADLIDRMLKAKPENGNYATYSFLSKEELEQLHSACFALSELKDLCDAAGDELPVNLLQLVYEQASKLNCTLHERFMEHTDLSSWRLEKAAAGGEA